MIDISSRRSRRQFFAREQAPKKSSAVLYTGRVVAASAPLAFSATGTCSGDGVDWCDGRCGRGRDAAASLRCRQRRGRPAKSENLAHVDDYVISGRICLISTPEDSDTRVSAVVVRKTVLTIFERMTETDRQSCRNRCRVPTTIVYSIRAERTQIRHIRAVTTFYYHAVHVSEWNQCFCACKRHQKQCEN